MGLFEVLGVSSLSRCQHYSRNVLNQLCDDLGGATPQRRLRPSYHGTPQPRTVGNLNVSPATHRPDAAEPW